MSDCMLQRTHLTQGLSCKAKAGYRLSFVDTLTDLEASIVENRINSMVKDLFDETIKDGTTDSLTTSSHHARDEGNYFSYLLTFYWMQTASFCFVVLSLISFIEKDTIFEIPSSLDPVSPAKFHPSTLYNHGETHRHPNVNFSVDSDWQTNTAGKSNSPWKLVMQKEPISSWVIVHSWLKTEVTEMMGIWSFMAGVGLCGEFDN
ncbi:hypothetical protein BDP27DRAFT_1412200 [Rhodocollybia butyracea]|uniref:Uncharacterized protein n=1 Tax=Rhodocollybia butyracea TaxID=206335 RepID=A0A9P5TUC5_9AGAR|nr:hypothetical protein BDP27DRAFT_1412200 [Rhodocollybia butyracea]